MVLVFVFSAPGVLPFTPETDLVLTAMTANNGAVLSGDPNLAAADFLGGGSLADGQYECLAVVTGNPIYGTVSAVPLEKGRDLFVAMGGVGAVFLYCDPVTQLN